METARPGMQPMDRPRPEPWTNLGFFFSRTMIFAGVLSGDVRSQYPNANVALMDKLDLIGQASIADVQSP